MSHSSATGVGKVVFSDGTTLSRQDLLNVLAGEQNLLFDPVYYLAHNPDVAASGTNPYLHYITAGWKEGRDPSALFSTNYYLAHKPINSGINPLQDFENGGWQAGRNPSSAFGTTDYIAANSDVRATRVDPLLQYVQIGKAQGRAAFAVENGTDPLVDPVYYYANNADVKAAGADAVQHYLSSGWTELRNPSAWFDTRYYLAQNPDIAAAHIDPLLHYETFGWKEGRDPSLLFSDAKYLASNPDIAAAGINPLAHYMSLGQAEGRTVLLAGGVAAADLLVNAAYYDKQLGATLLPTGTAAAQQAAASYSTTGWQHNLNPDAYFNTA